MIAHSHKLYEFTGTQPLIYSLALATGGTTAMGMVVGSQLVVVMTSPSGAAYMGGQMSRRDEEFHQTLIVLEHICDVN